MIKSRVGFFLFLAVLMASPCAFAMSGRDV